MSSARTLPAGVVRPRASAGEAFLWRAWETGERLVSALLLLALASPLLLTGIVIVLLSRRTPLVAHQRQGRHGHPFWMLKFRTMWGGPERAQRRFPALISYVREEPAWAFKASDDPRITSRFARFCRRYSLDELPQLAHVVTGKMALVGPRPLTHGELKTHYGSAASEVLEVKPGLTGLWQVMGRSRLSYAERRKLDLALVRSRSVRGWTTILLRTIPQVLSGKDSW